MPYFGDPIGRVKIQETNKNILLYYALNCLIRDLLFNLAGKMEKWSTYKLSELRDKLTCLQSSE